MRLVRIREAYQSGRITEAQTALRSMPLRRLKREERLALAFLARELRLPQIAIKALFPVVHSGNLSRRSDATDEEKTEYSMALVAIGCNAEAKRTLKSINLEKSPRAAMGLINAYFREWQWPQALPLIEQLLPYKPLRRRESLSVRLDHAIASFHSHGNGELCRKRVTELLSELGPTEFSTIRFDSLLLVLNSFFLERNWDSCWACLKDLRNVYGDNVSPYLRNVIEMWQALTALGEDSRKGGDRGSKGQTLQGIRERFVELGRSNFARFCDYYAAMATRDPLLAHRLYFGSPLPAVQGRAKRLLDDLGGELPGSFEIQMENSRAGPLQAPNVLSPGSAVQFSAPGSKSLRLKIGQLPHRMLMALTQDLYLRPGLNQLFEQVYPAEHYHPEISIKRIEQGLWRLRLSLKAARVPAKITMRNGGYAIQSTAPLSLRFVAHSAVLHKAHDFWRARLRAAFGAEEFSRSQFSTSFGVPERSARHLLKQLLDDGAIRRIGAARGIRYVLREG